ncbi:phage tail assembly protein [Saccharibacter floricola]|uniref:Phage tail assembly protein n=1 Tax=Saccharibacter floricola DSM 15669 TaxID=1123227 RepID=A0ABQ0P1A3_9PROT|nr:phage tail assembly protein [Saccharibacter floricola]GBQ08942.1 hypothetical protein AA15669_1974 [Saccharibacter floricola DSM 15669]
MTSSLPHGATLQDDGTVHYTLLRPISIETTTKDGPSQITLAELTFREPTAGDLIDSGLNGSNSAAAGLALLGTLTGHVGPVGDKLLRAMNARDYIASQKVVAAFFDDGQKAGQ